MPEAEDHRVQCSVLACASTALIGRAHYFNRVRHYCREALIIVRRMVLQQHDCKQSMYIALVPAN